MLEALTEEQWQHWEEQGYVRLGVQLSVAEVGQLQLYMMLADRHQRLSGMSIYSKKSLNLFLGGKGNPTKKSGQTTPAPL